MMIEVDGSERSLTVQSACRYGWSRRTGIITLWTPNWAKVHDPRIGDPLASLPETESGRAPEFGKRSIIQVRYKPESTD
jgi:hypothetical protein